MQRRSAWVWGALFAVTRLLFIVWLSPRVSWDVYYYWFSVNDRPGVSDTLIEYPTPVVWFATALHAIVPGRLEFQLAFALLFVAIDGLTAVALWRKHPAAGRYWVLFGTAVGVIGYYRLDLAPAALVALACLMAYAKPRTSGALLGLGAAIKLWPALLAVPLLGPTLQERGGRRRLAGFMVVGGGLGLASLLVSGWTRSTTPLTWQHDRGLHIESVAATPLMIARSLDPANSAWALRFSRYNAWEIVGPGADALTSLTTVGTLGTMLFVLWLGVRAYRRREANLSIVEGTLATTLATICWLIVTNKTFSPQYIWWLAGPLALLFAIGGRGYRRLGWSAIAIALATQYVFPWAYDPVVAGQGFAIFVLAARNVGMLALAIIASVAAWRATSHRFRVASSHQA